MVLFEPQCDFLGKGNLIETPSQLMSKNTRLTYRDTESIHVLKTFAWLLQITSHIPTVLLNFLDRNFLFFASEIIIFRQEKHAVTFVALSHRNARTVPVPDFDFGLFVFVVATRTKRGSERCFVLNHNTQWIN